MLQAVDASAGGAFLAGAGSSLGLGGARLAAAGVAADATIRETDGTGRILAVLKAAAGGADEWRPLRPVAYRGTVFVTIAGAGAVLILYGS